ncbi:MAG TPA: hypothetical protein VM889_11540 [Candidatus Thermoplasmatota archaeon]|nr:hypothetical protein [Candidatus Thermoplasmatota archaeon]
MARDDVSRFHLEDVGDEALSFARWFLKSRFDLMESFTAELARAPRERDVAALKRRFHKATRHAKRVQLARLVVTVLLALGAVTTVLAAAGAALSLPREVDAPVEAGTALLDEVAALAGTATVGLVALRLGFDRYLDLVGVTATFVAMQITASAGATGSAPSRP